MKKQEAESAVLAPSQFTVSLRVVQLTYSACFFMQNRLFFCLPTTQGHCKINRRVLAKLLARKKWESLIYLCNQCFIWTQRVCHSPSLAQGWGDGMGPGTFNCLAVSSNGPHSGQRNAWWQLQGRREVTVLSGPSYEGRRSSACQQWSCF